MSRLGNTVGVLVDEQKQRILVEVRYDAATIEFLKSLKGSFWNAKKKRWILPLRKEVLEAVQDKWNIWDNVTLIAHVATCKHSANKGKKPYIVLSTSGEHLEVDVSNAPEVLYKIKQISGRKYLSSSQTWVLPSIKGRVERIESFCQAKGILVHTNTTPSSVPSASHPKNDYQSLKAYIVSRWESKEHPYLLPLLDAMLLRRYSRATIQQYMVYARRQLHAIGVEAILEKSNAEILEACRAQVLQRSETNASRSSLNGWISALKLWCKSLGIRVEVSALDVMRPRKERYLPVVLSKGEVKRLLEKCTNTKHKTMLMLSYGCGLRSGEVVHLRRQDLQFHRGMILVHKGKGHKDRQVPMGKSLHKQLQKYLGEYRVGFWCFEGSREGMPYHASSLRMVFKRALAQAGLHASVRLHDLRHSFATHLMESGTDIKIIQALLGHESIVTTQIYTHVSSTSVLGVVSPIEDLLDE